MQFQSSELNNFMPPNQTTTLGNDDQTSWALAAMTAAEVGFPKPEDGNWIDYAKNVFDNQVLRYEVDERSWGTCGGGLRWQILSFNAGWDYKNTASNGNFFLLAARLARFTGNQTYSAWADKTFSWAQEIGLISDDYYVYDGAGTRQNCTQINFVQWSQNLGIMTEGAAIMFNIVRPSTNRLFFELTLYPDRRTKLDRNSNRFRKLVFHLPRKQCPRRDHMRTLGSLQH